MPDLKCIEGSGDILAAIDRLRAQALAGELDAIVYATCTKDPSTDGVIGRAFRDDMDYPLARMIAAGDQLLTYLRMQG